MLRSSFSKAGIALTLLAALNMSAMEIELKPAFPAAKPSVVQNVGSFFHSLGSGIVSRTKSASTSAKSAIYAAPQAAYDFCKKNPKKVGIGAAVVAAVVGTAGYLYATGFFKNIFSKAKATAKK